MTTVSCFTGQFDSKEDPCITESMLRAPEKGAVLIITPAREGVPIFHSPKDFRLMVSEGKLDGTTETMTRFWMYGLEETENGYLTAGEAFYKMKQTMGKEAEKTSGYHWCQAEINLLGDPTIYLRANKPVKPQVKFPKVLKAGQEIPVKLSTGVKNSMVCIWQKGGLYKIVKGDEKGNFSFNISGLKPGEVSFAVYGPDLNAVVQKISIK